MTLQFQPPQGPRQKTKAESFAEPLTSAVQSLPLLYLQHQNQKKQLELQALQMDLAKKELLAKYGTGEGAPTFQNASPDMLQHGAAPSTPSTGGPEEQLFGDVGSMPAMAPETQEQKLRRIGYEAYKTLNPTPTTLVDQSGNPIRQVTGKVQVAPGETQYAIPTYDAQGNVAGFTNAPKNTRIVGGGKPQLSEEDKLSAKNTAKIESEKPKAIGSFNNTIREFDNMISEAQAIKDDPSLSTATGALMGRTSLPGGSTRVVSRLDTLKAKTLLNVLASMKDLSKNGSSGFGQLSEVEGENIRNSISSLNRKQSTSDFKDSLDRFIKEMEAKKQNLTETFNSTYGPSEQNQYTGLPSIGELFQGHKVLSVKKVK